MKNRTWVYADNRRVEVFLHMGNKFFNRMYSYERDILGRENEKVVVQIIRYAEDSKDLSICCWYWKKRDNENHTYGSLLFEWKMPFIKDGVYSLCCDLPKTENWHAIRSCFSTVKEKKPTKDNAFYYQNHVGFECFTNDEIKDNEEAVKLTIDRYMTKDEAKATWKHIKKNNWVSKFYWDSWMHEYDCYCNFCKAISATEPRRSWKSWVSNPDIGYVWPDEIHCKSDYVYKGKAYVPCPAELYDRLCFFNKEQYEEEIKDKAGRFKTFDELWNEELTAKEIKSNGNVYGGAWRNLLSKNIIAKDDIDDADDPNLEKVVTLGWHRTEIEHAVRCPVCDDLYEIICRSDYNPVPFFKRLKEKIVWKAERSKLDTMLSNFLYNLKETLKCKKRK